MTASGKAILYGQYLRSSTAYSVFHYRVPDKVFQNQWLLMACQAGLFSFLPELPS